MNLKNFLLEMISKNALTLEQANAGLSNFQRSVIDEYVGLQYVPGARGGVEVDVSMPVLEKLFSRIRDQWIKLGETEPYHSVLTTEKFRMKHIKQNLAEFQGSGELEVRRLLQLVEKNNLEINFGTCLELGCGVGRTTAYLAPKFEKVIAFDISPGNISLAESYLAELRAKIGFRLMSSLEDFDYPEKIDVFISFMVLQHNPPPLQKFFLERIFNSLKPGGIFFFQTVTHAPSYQYSAEANFRYPAETESEMHCLPISNVFKIIEESGLSIVDVIKDGGGHNHDSNSFFGMRRL
jgi:2-polyprenyl-3-methyl-5-hydroxy-6-metoxy-1,4-benzoquinol methylase